MYINLIKVDNMQDMKAEIFYNGEANGLRGSLEFLADTINMMYKKIEEPVYLDLNGVGIALANLLDELGFKYSALKINKRIKEGEVR